MNAHRGDVVLLNYPFPDATGSKVRPALVVQADSRNSRILQTIVAMVTRNVSRIGIDPTQLLVDISTPDGQRSGLRVNSAVVCGNLFTINERHLIATIGQLTGNLMSQVNDCLRTALELH